MSSDPHPEEVLIGVAVGFETENLAALRLPDSDEPDVLRYSYREYYDFISVEKAYWDWQIRIRDDYHALIRSRMEERKPDDAPFDA